MEEDLHVEVNVAGRPSNYHQNPISWPMQCRVPDPNPAFNFQLPASSFVLVQLPAFCQRLFAKLIPKKVSQTCDLKQSVPARLEQPTNHPAPHLPFRQVLHTKGQSLCPFLFYSFCCCSCCLPSGQWPPPQLCSAQLSSASTQFVTIPFCGLIFALLVSLSYFPFLPLSLSNPIPDRLRFYLPRCPARPGLPFVCSVCFRTLFKLTCAYFLMLPCVGVCGRFSPSPKRCWSIVI